MAEKETGFSVDITLSAVITSKDGNTEDVEDIGIVLEILKDITLLNLHFNELEYFQVKQIRKIEDEVILTCFVFSSQELEDLKKALESRELAKQITEYALASGLEVFLGLMPSAKNVQVDILLEKKDKVFRQGATFFKKQMSEGKCDSDRKSKVTKTEIKAKADKEKPTSKKKNVVADEKLSNAQSPKKINSDARSQQNQQQNSSVEQQQDGYHHQQQEQPKQQHHSDTVSGRDGVQNIQTIPQNKPEVSNTIDTSTTRTKAGDRPQSQRREATSGIADSEVNITKQVVVNIAPSFVAKSNVESVKIEFRNKERTLCCFKLYGRTETIWDTDVMTFAPDEEDLYCRIYIYYWKFFAIGVSEWSSEWVPLPSSYLPLHFGKYDIDVGFCNHIFYIMENASFVGLKESIMNAETVFHLFHYDIRHQHTILRIIQNKVEKRGIYWKKESFDLLGYVYGRLTEYHKAQDFHLQPKIGTAILDSIKHLKEDDVPSKSLSSFMKIFETLCEVAFPKSKCQFFTLFAHGFRFLPVKYFSEAVDRYRQDLSSLKKSDFESIQAVLNRCLPANCPDTRVVNFVEKLARHVPLTIIVPSKPDLCNIIGEMSFQEILDMKIKGECRTVEKKGTVTDILEILDVLSPFEEFTENMSSSIEQSFIVVLRNTKPDNTFPENMMARLIHSKLIFRTTTSKEQLLLLMAESKNTWLHSNFIILLKDLYNEELGSDFLAESTLKWFLVAIANHCDKSYYKKPVDDLPLAYAHLSTALSVECVSKQDDLVTQLKDKAYEFMKTVSPSDLVDKVQSQDDFENSAENQIVLEHMHKYLFEETKQSKMHSIMAKAGRSSWSFGTRKCTRLFATLLQTAIESADFERSKETSAVFLKIAKNAKLWINVIAYSKEHELLKNNKILKKTVEKCKVFGENHPATSAYMSPLMLQPIP